MATPQENIKRLQEISDRGLQDSLPPEKRARFDEAVKRGLILSENTSAETQIGGLAPETPLAGKDTGNEFFTESQPPNANANQGSGLADAAIDAASTVWNAGGDFASAVNRSVVGGVDFFTLDQVNNILQLAGTDKRVPTLSQGAAALGATQGGNLEPGLLQDVVTTAGNTVPIALSVGGLARNVASKLPAIQEGTESIGKGIARQFGVGSPASDVAAAGLSSVGAELGEEIGGETGKLIGSVVAPLAPAAIKSATAPIKTLFQQAAQNKALKDAVPDITQLKTQARSLYKQVDELGVSINQKPLQNLSNSIASLIKKEGFNARIHPKVSAALDEVALLTQKSMTISEIDTMRKVARSAARSIDPDEARLGSMMVEKIDNFVGNIPTGAISGGNAKTVSPLLKEARGLWGRAKKSELLDDAFERAQNQASGFENGLRTQFRSILNNKKKLGSFNAEEIKAMQLVVRGGKAENIAKALGKFGFTEGQATSVLMPTLGAGIGGAVGGFGGAAAVPLLGTGAKKLAENLTRRNAELAAAMTRSGSNGKQIVSSYFKSMPKNQRSVEELTGLLLQNKAIVDPLRQSSNKMVADAAYFASVIMSAKPDSSEPNEDAVK